MIVTSKQNIEKACKGAKLKRGGRCPRRGLMKGKRKGPHAKMLKAGGKSGIHIKENMEGTFTEWCGRHGYDGVTAECISAGKSSNDPRIRKKATFAANARKWNK